MKFVLAMVLAGSAALPLSVSAQAIEEGTAPTVEEPAPEEPPLELDDAGVKVTPTRDGFYILDTTSVEPDLQKPGVPWLRLELDSAGLEITPTVLKRTEPRVGLTRRAKIGIGVGVGVALALGIATAVAVSQMDFGSWE